MLIKRLIFYESDEIEIRLRFYGSFSTFWNMYLVVFALKFFIHLHRVRGDLKSLCCKIKSHICNHNPNIKPEVFKF